MKHRVLFVFFAILLAVTSILAPAPDWLSKISISGSGGPLGLQDASAADLAADTVYDSATDDNATLYPFQRKVIYAASNFWVLFSDGTNLVIYRSLDGDTWTNAVGVKANSKGYTASMWYDSENICVAYAPGTSNTALQYVQYTPYDNGTLSIQTSWQNAQPANVNLTYMYPFVSKDTSGYPVISYTCDNGTDTTPYVTRANQNNGTWTSDNFNTQLSTDNDATWRACVLPVASQDLIGIYARDGQTIKSKIYDYSAVSFLGENATTSYAQAGSYFSAVVTSDYVAHLVFSDNAEDIRYTHYHSGGTIWETEETVYDGTSTTMAPVLSKTLDDNLYCAWLGDSSANHVYYKTQTNGTWDTSATGWLTESNITANSSITAAYEQTDTNYIGVSWLTGAGSPYNIRFAALETSGVDIPLSGFSHTQTVKVTNSSNETLTNPVIRIPLIPYTAIERDVETIDGNEYRYCIPISVTELSGDNLSNYEFKIGPIDTKWLKDNAWATDNGNEVRFTAANKSTLLNFFLEPNPGWNSTSTYYRVQDNWTAYAQNYIYLWCDSDLTAASSDSSSAWITSGGGYFTDFSTFVNASNTQLLGNSAAGVANANAGVLVYQRFTATAGTCTHIRVNSLVAGNVVCAIYADSGGNPTGSPIAKQSTSFACSIGTNYVPLESSVVLTATDYWLGFNTGTTGVMGRISASGGDCQYKASTYASPYTFTITSLTDGLASDYAISGYNVVAASMTGWTITGSPTYAAGVLTIPGGATMTSNAAYDMGYTLSVYAQFGAAGAGAARLGFTDSDASDYVRFTHDSTNDLGIAASKASSAFVSPDQYPFPVSSYALWEVIRSKDQDNKDEWDRWLVDHVQCTNSPFKASSGYIPTISLPIYLTGGTNGLLVKWVQVTQNTRPEPMINIPQIHHDPNTVFLEDGCEHWPYDIAVTAQGNLNQFYYTMDNVTLSSEYATELYTKYQGVITNGQTISLTVHYGNSSISSPSSYWNDAQVYDSADSWNAGDESAWTEVAGTWVTSDQQRPEIFDYHLLNIDPSNASSIWMGSPVWLGTDNIQRMICFVGSWAGVTVNNQGNAQWQIPWQLVLYEKHGSQWYRFGNVLTSEYNGSNHASVIPYFAWIGDGSYLGNADWVYLVVGTTTIAAGDNACWIFANKDKSGKSWEVLNDGIPFADWNSITGGASADMARFTQIVWDSTHSSYMIPYGWSDATDAGHQYDVVRYLYTDNATRIATFQDLLTYDNATIDPDTAWTDGGDIIAVTQTCETPWFYQTDTGEDDWIAVLETIADRNVEYATVKADGDGHYFHPGMTASNWNATADMTDIDDSYVWSAGDVATPMIYLDSANSNTPTMAYNGEGGDYAVSHMNTNKGIAFATASTVAGTGWTPSNVDTERYQSNTSVAWALSYYTGDNLTEGTIACSTSSAQGTEGRYGIIWRYQDADNFYYWCINDIEETISYGKKTGGSWADDIADYDPGEDIWFGEEYRLRVLFDGTTTTLQYSKLGWKWITAYSGITLTDANIPESGYWGTCSRRTAALWDDIRTSPYNTLEGSYTELNISVSPTTWTSFYKEGTGSSTSTLRGDTWYTSDNDSNLDYFTLTNESLLTVDVLISSSDNWTGTGKTWTVSPIGEPGNSTIGIWAGLEGSGGYYILVKPADPSNFLCTNLATSSTQDFGLKVFTCTSNGGNASMSGTVTLTAVVHT